MIINPTRDVLLRTQLNVGMKGFYRLRTINKFSGKVRIDTGWFENILLTSGMNEMGNTINNWLTHCQVGTDNTAPQASDSSLLGLTAGTSDIVQNDVGQQGSAPYFGWRRLTYRFAAGTVAANLSEVGVGWDASGSTLVSRALILDPILQTPTTVTPLADELLDVTYELRYYPPLVDATSPQVELHGVTYDTITRAASVTGSRWSNSIGSQIGEWTDLNGWKAYDGNIGTIIQAPSGLSANPDNDNHWNSAYSNNSFQRDINCQIGSQGWNLGAGIRSVRFRTTCGDFQTQFNAVGTGNTVPKSTSYSIQLSWTIGWSEYVAP